jgi:hypothetical protein
MLDHMPIGEFADRRPRRLDLDAQRRAALNARAGLVVLCRSGFGHPGRCKGERRKPNDPYPHGLSSLECATVSHCCGDVNRQPHSTPFDTVSDNVSQRTWQSCGAYPSAEIPAPKRAKPPPHDIFLFINRDKSAL